MNGGPDHLRSCWFEGVAIDNVMPGLNVTGMFTSGDEGGVSACCLDVVDRGSYAGLAKRDASLLWVR